MKVIKGFEDEDIVVSDFGEWVGKNYIDYKSEYKNNQKIIKILFDENKQQKYNWNKLKEWVNKHYDYYMNEEDYIGGRLCFGDMKTKMQELESENDSNGKND